MAELSEPASGSQVIEQAASSQEQAGGADTGNASRARTGDGDDRRGSDREPGPAETSTREQYADEMRSGPPAEHNGAADTDVVTGDDQSPAGLDAHAGTQAPDTQNLAEPRTRAEIADEARSRTVPTEYLPSQDGHRTPAETRDGQGGALRPEHDDRPDEPDSRFSVVQADRTLGDTTPTGIGLKPTGEEIRDMESDLLSRGARFRKNVYERADDIQDSTEKTAGTLQGLLGAHRPTGHDVSFTAQPGIDVPAPPPPADAGNIATTGLVLGLLADRAIHWGRQRLWQSKG